MNIIINILMFFAVNLIFIGSGLTRDEDVDSINIIKYQMKNGSKKFSVSVDLDDKRRVFNVLLRDGNNAIMKDNAETAIFFYKEALKLYENNVDANLWLGISYHINKQFVEAEKYYRQVLKIEPFNINAVYNLSLLLTDINPKFAIEEMNAFYKKHRKFAFLPAQIGISYIKLEKCKEALPFLEDALIKEPNNLRYLFNTAICLEKIGKIKSAQGIYKGIIAKEDRAVSSQDLDIINQAKIRSS